MSQSDPRHPDDAFLQAERTRWAAATKEIGVLPE